MFEWFLVKHYRLKIYCAKVLFPRWRTSMYANGSSWGKKNFLLTGVYDRLIVL